MSGEQALERSVLERKERDELQTIAEALGVKPGSRTKKADLIGQILVAAGVETAPAPAEGDANGAAEKPKRTRTRKAAAPAVEAAPSEAAEAAGADPKQPTLDAAVAEQAPAAESNGQAEAPPTPDAGGDAEAKVQTGDGATTDAPAPEEAAKGEGGDRQQAQQGQQGQGQGRNQGQGQGQGRNRDRGDRGDRQGGQGGQGGGGQNQQRQPREQRQPGNFDDGQGDGRRSRRRRGRDRERDRDFRVQEQTAEQQYQGELIEVTGLLDLTDQGYGYLRTKGYLPNSNDVYVSTSQAKRFALRKGDAIEGAARPAMGNEKYGALLRIDKINGQTPEEARDRRRYEDLTPLFPDIKLRISRYDKPENITGRIIDLISPIGKGQRGMIVSPPKAGKTTVIKEIATAIEFNNPEVHLMVLLVDERPEEVTMMKRTLQKGEVVASTFDRPSDEHTLVAELALERAKRLVELGQDVVIILDGITRLARAYNLSAPASGRLTSGGIDQAAIYPPKKFFGAARNIEEGGSLTILATALVETGSKADDVIFEEFKGTGNMELRLDRRLAERRVYPAIDVNASSTRHEELLFDGRKQLELVWRLRRVLNGLAEDGSSARSLELLIEKLKTTKTNEEFLADVAKAQNQTI
jgi:transcription termination factor Rho